MSGPRRHLALIIAACLCVLALPAVAAAASVHAEVYLTTAQLGAALARQPDVSFGNRPLARGIRVLNVDDHIRYQSIVGFGAAMTDSSTWLIHNALTPGARRQVLEQLFSPSQGLGLNFVRVPIGGSDFDATAAAYTYDDLAAGQTDPTLAHFSIDHDLSYVIPTLQQMLKVNPAIDVISTDWTAPAWMKANDATGDLGRAGVLLSQDYPVLARYIVRFVQAYAGAGIPIWAVTPVNEPGTSVNYPSMNLTPAQEAAFIAQDLAPAFRAAGIEARIYGGDTGSAEPGYAEAAQSLSSAAAVSGEAWHCYGGQQGITAFHNLFAGAQELMTECSPGIIPYTGGEAAIDAIRNWASSAALWNVALDPSGGPVAAPNSGCPNCTGLLTINEATHKVLYTRDYYQLGQLAKFVARGAVRIATPRWVSDFRTAAGSTQVSQGLDNVAFLNPDGSRVLVAYDKSPHPITFGVSWDDKQFSYTLAGGAMVTFTWTGSEPHAPVASVARCFNAGVRYVASGADVVARPAC